MTERLNWTAATAAPKSLQSCPTLCDHIDGSPSGSPVPGILQAKPGVGCRFLLQCMKVKSQSEVTQSCPTPSKILEWGATAFSELNWVDYKSKTSFWNVVLSYSIQHQWTISQSDCDMQQKVDFILPETTSSVTGPKLSTSQSQSCIRIPEWSSGFRHFLQFQYEFGSKEFMIQATVSS